MGAKRRVTAFPPLFALWPGVRFLASLRPTTESRHEFGTRGQWSCASAAQHAGFRHKDMYASRPERKSKIAIKKFLFYAVVAYKLANDNLVEQHETTASGIPSTQ